MQLNQFFLFAWSSFTKSLIKVKIEIVLLGMYEHLFMIQYNNICFPVIELLA